MNGSRQRGACDHLQPILTGAAIAMLAGCGSSSTIAPPPPPPPPPAASCASVAVTQLAVGEHTVVDPAQTSGCVRVPQAGASGAEYIVVAASTATNRSTSGISGSFQLRASNPGASASAQPVVSRVESLDQTPIRQTVAQQFHDMLRQREAQLAARPESHVIQAAPRVAAAPPTVGDVRTFKTCKDLNCTIFEDVTATARFVGTKAAIYMDNDVPQADTLLETDYQDLGQTFDNYHYPIDNAAFGSESDLDNNQRIVVLMTNSVNNLTPDCTNGRVLGYFFGLDLITTGPDAVNSNKGEIFYTFVPSPATPKCSAISRSTALGAIKPTLIHEFQHMISWNQRVLILGGNSEETWLNEAMSHFAEELGGRLIPNSECPGFSSCRSMYVSGNIINAYDYLKNTESQFLIFPTSSSGTLEERGASWSFLRWVVDQFAADSLIGNDLTRSLETGPGGAATIVARTGTPFSQLVPEWLLAEYLDDLDGFTPLSDRLRYKSWGLRAIWTNPLNQAPNGPFTGFPLVPDVTSGGYSRTGTLRGGSGRHLRLVQAPNGAAIDVQLLKDAQGSPIDPLLAARIGIARIH